MKTTTTTTTITQYTDDNGTYQMYVTDLKDYNNGSLVGYWMDLQDKTKDEIKEEINDFLEARTEATGELHEEWFITDWENVPDFGEYPDLEQVVKYVELIVEYGDAFEVWFGYDGLTYNQENLSDVFKEAYCGAYKNGLKDYAYELVESGYFGDVAERLKNYIDYEAIANDLDNDGYWDDAGYVFRSV